MADRKSSFVMIFTTVYQTATIHQYLLQIFDLLQIFTVSAALKKLNKSNAVMLRLPASNKRPPLIKCPPFTPLK